MGFRPSFRFREKRQFNLNYPTGQNIAEWDIQGINNHNITFKKKNKKPASPKRFSQCGSAALCSSIALNLARGELAEAEVNLDLALLAFRELGDRRNEAMMLNNTGYLRRRQGRMEEAEGYHLRSLEIREEIGDLVGVGRIYSMLTGVYAAQGRYQDAKLAGEGNKLGFQRNHTRA